MSEKQFSNLHGKLWNEKQCYLTREIGENNGTK